MKMANKIKPLKHTQLAYRNVIGWWLIVLNNLNKLKSRVHVIHGVFWIESTIPRAAPLT